MRADSSLIADSCRRAGVLGAWGMEVHKDITRRALDALPAEIAVFRVQRFIVEHSADPDPGASSICAAIGVTKSPTISSTSTG